jgi:DNA-binding Lrp family transcriptional regulator
MTDRGEEPGAPFSGRLDDRVLAALHGLPGRIAFSGLRRALGAHPESLARTLRRLEREGRVERVGGAYRALKSGAPPTSAGIRTVAQLDLAAGADPTALFARLSGRWFGSLRWVGVIDAPEGHWLVWGGRDGGPRVMLGLLRGSLAVGVPRRTYADDPAEAEDAAFELLSHVVEVIRAPPSDGAAPTVRAFARIPLSDPRALAN